MCVCVLCVCVCVCVCVHAHCVCVRVCVWRESECVCVCYVCVCVCCVCVCILMIRALLQRTISLLSHSCASSFQEAQSRGERCRERRNIALASEGNRSSFNTTP